MPGRQVGTTYIFTRDFGYEKYVEAYYPRTIFELKSIDTFGTPLLKLSLALSKNITEYFVKNKNGSGQSFIAYSVPDINFFLEFIFKGKNIYKYKK